VNHEEVRVKGNGGFSLIELLVVILIIGVLVALVVPNLVLMQERARRTAVRGVMRALNVAVQAYAADNNGTYPGEGSFTKSALANWGPPGMDIIYWFPGGDPIGANGSPIPGVMPSNPYTGRRYNYEDEDMDGESYYGLLEERGQHTQCLSSDPDCPYLDLPAPNELEGTVCIVSYVSEQSANGAMEEYGIVGYGRDVTEPMFDRVADDAAGARTLQFFVLAN